MRFTSTATTWGALLALLLTGGCSSGNDEQDDSVKYECEPANGGCYCSLFTNGPAPSGAQLECSPSAFAGSVCCADPEWPDTSTQSVGCNCIPRDDGQCILGMVPIANCDRDTKPSSNGSTASQRGISCKTSGEGCSCSIATPKNATSCSASSTGGTCCKSSAWPTSGTCNCYEPSGSCGLDQGDASLSFNCRCNYGTPAKKWALPPVSCSSGSGYCCSFNRTCACYAGSGNCAEIGGTPVPSCSEDLFPPACAAGTTEVSSCSSSGNDDPGTDPGGGGGCDPSDCRNETLCDEFGCIVCSYYCSGNSCVSGGCN